MIRSRRLLVLVAAAVATASLGLAGAPAASSEPQWASPSEATIHPGVMMFTQGAQCTANFIFTEGDDVFIGYAAHCAGTGAATDTNGCDAGTLPIDTPVEIDGASQPGTLAYSSWITMQDVREADSNACNYNDFALVKLHPADHGRVNPSVPHWGGPTGLNTSGVPAMTDVYSYGNSSLRLGITLLSPKTGVSLGTTGGGWAHPVYTVSPGIPGDSGSAMLDDQGRAAGVLSTLAIAPLAGSNNYIDLNLALQYMRSNGGPNAQLVFGDEAFDSGQLPLHTDGGLLGL
jgi:hypothetical protein